MCYDHPETDEQIDDCLATFEEPPPQRSEFLKTSDADVALLRSLPGERGKAYLKLESLGIPSPVYQLLVEMWAHKELFDEEILKPDEVRAQFAEEIFQARHDRFDDITADLKDVPGLAVVRHLAGLDFIEVEIGVGSLEFVDELAAVDRVIVANPNAKVEAHYAAEAPPILEHMQLHSPYYVYQDGSAGEDGAYDMPGSWSRVVVAVNDFTRMHANHVAFKDGSGGSFRVLEAWTCADDSCSEVVPATGFCPAQTLPLSELNKHGTVVASLLAGDLRDLQDPVYDDPGDYWARIRRSGQAPEAGLVFLAATEDSEESNVAVVNQTIERQVHVDSCSLGISVTNPSGYDCNPSGPFSEATNATFLSDILTVQSAGNDGDAEACTVASPGDAESALTIGALGDLTQETLADWDAADRSDYSSHGPHNYYGSRERTIVDLVAPADVARHPSSIYNQDYGATAYVLWDPPVTGTSYAQPRVAAALVDAIDFMVGTRGDQSMLLPGIQTVFMLMMGDRACESGYRVAGFSSRWGAGRTLMRRIDDTGMDGPWGRANYFACVGDGDEVILPVKNGERLSSASDRFKAVIWWYTSSFSNPIPNDIDLRLQWSDNGTTWTTIRSDTGSDLKKMVYYHGVGNYYLRLKVTGADVNGSHGDGSGCSSGQAKVYYMWMYEDDARDDADGPGSDIQLM
jgi:hypothetical protein